MKLRALLATLSLFLFVAGCGKEMGRVPFGGEGAGEKEIALEAGEVSFWTDIDIEYEGNAALTYQVELFQGGAKIGTATCNPLAHFTAKVGWVETNIGNSHTRSGNGKMPCSATLTKGGPTVIKATLAFAQKPAKLKLAKADLVVKQ